MRTLKPAFARGWEGMRAVLCRIRKPSPWPGESRGGRPALARQGRTHRTLPIGMTRSDAMPDTDSLEVNRELKACTPHEEGTEGTPKWGTC